jgi:hypothetical protein
VPKAGQKEAKAANKRPKKGQECPKRFPRDRPRDRPREARGAKKYGKTIVKCMFWLSQRYCFRRGEIQHRSDEADPRESQDRPKREPREAKRAKTGPKTAQDRPKRAPRGTKRNPRGAQDASKRAQKSTQAAGEPQDTSKNSQEVQKVPKRILKGA